MTPTKIALAGAAMTVLLIMFATRPDPAPPTEKDQNQVKTVQTLALAQIPFETPSWVPDEATKKKALMRAYELNGNKMCCGSIDVSGLLDQEPSMPPDPLPPGDEISKKLELGVTDPKLFNALDAAAADKPNWEAKRRFMDRTFRATRDQLAHLDEAKPATDVCKRHGLHKVEYGGKWRCRK